MMQALRGYMRQRAARSYNPARYANGGQYGAMWHKRGEPEEGQEKRAGYIRLV